MVGLEVSLIWWLSFCFASESISILCGQTRQVETNGGQVLNCGGQIQPFMS